MHSVLLVPRRILPKLELKNKQTNKQSPTNQTNKLVCKQT